MKERATDTGPTLEKYAPFYDKLIARQATLRQRLEQIKKDAMRKANADWSEQAQERENDEVIDALGNETLNELRLIQRALQRLEDGDYGVCRTCHCQIALARLEVMPCATLCIHCADKH
ncbi:MAG: TraR/DksA C4-type zinc finger protein [Kistimonas sp.]|nr:TraR/DksA C4-type zinc finger protein [Kistimonas sp.]